MEGVRKWVLLWGGGCGCEEESVGVRRSVCVCGGTVVVKLNITHRLSATIWRRCRTI